MNNGRFAEHLRGLREAKGLTQEQLAQAAKVTVGTVAGLEQGKRYPNVRTFLKLRAILPKLNLTEAR